MKLVNNWVNSFEEFIVNVSPSVNKNVISSLTCYWTKAFQHLIWSATWVWDDAGEPRVCLMIFWMQKMQHLIFIWLHVATSYTHSDRLRSHGIIPSYQFDYHKQLRISHCIWQPLYLDRTKQIVSLDIHVAIQFDDCEPLQNWSNIVRSASIHYTACT